MANVKTNRKIITEESLIDSVSELERTHEIVFDEQQNIEMSILLMKVEVTKGF